MNGETVLNNRYTLVAQQGAGGMAVIYKAQDQLLARMVAVKVLRPSLTADPAFITRFQNEARAIANLQHPNIVTVHDVGMHTSPKGVTHYIVMEFVEGPDLKKIIKTSTVVDVSSALTYAIQICAGIGYAHRAQIVHADVKPQNILVASTGGDTRVKVTDFGIAQALSDTQPQQREAVVWGSPHYFSPEQARGERPTARSDVYSIGIVLFEMLTGRLPYLGGTQQELALAHIKAPLPRITDHDSRLPEGLASIVATAMAKEPQQRYRDADQLGRILLDYQQKGEERTEPRVAAARPNAPPPTVAPETVARQPVVPPPSSLPQTSRPHPPSARPPTAPPTVPGMPVSLPTERVPVAPEAPGGVPLYPPQPARPLDPLVDRYQPTPQTIHPGIPAPAPSGYESAPYPPRQDSQAYVPRPQTASAPPLMDAVMIILALVTLIAVACLIPLYIAVAQAWNIFG